MDHPFQAHLMTLTVATLLEIEAVGLDQGAVLALTVAVAQVPPPKRQVVLEHGIARGFLVLADGIVAAAQCQLIGQARRAVPVEGGATLPSVVAVLAIVLPRQPN